MIFYYNNEHYMWITLRREVNVQHTITNEHGRRVNHLRRYKET